MGSWAMPRSRNGTRKATRTPATRPNSGARMTPISASTLSGPGPCEGEENAMNDLEVAAEHAVLTGQIRSLVAWVGSGRKLTQTGRIGLADARHLVELLGTGDTIDPKIGDRVFKTKSSEELAHLTRIVEWAKAARLVRVTGTRLVPVKKNAALPDRPLDLV